MAVNAHDAIIYGIDWSRHSEYELTTCSLDKTVKFWDTRTTDRDEHGPGARLLNTIQTDYPVWRAKYSPFGRGVLTQPHRESAKLEMYRSDKVDEPVHTFEGFEGVVKEYVWRLKGGENDAYGMQTIISSAGRFVNTRFPDDREFQLITWSQDCVLRFWPIEQSLLEVPISSNQPVSRSTNFHSRKSASKEAHRLQFLSSEEAHPSSPIGTCLQI